MTLRIAEVFVLILLATTFVCGQDTTDSKRTDSHLRRHQAAIKSARSALDSEDDRPTASSLIRLGDALLRAGQCDEAVEVFEKAIFKEPEAEPYLWQHGIALFFVERYQAGKALFEKHRRVNPNDVENAAWHFLCVAKSDGLDEARSMLLPAPGDRRTPMQQILERLPGGDSTAINAAVDKIVDPARRISAQFYANLYLGLIADAEGEAKMARVWMRKAAETPLTHYMADVARVYSRTLSGKQR